MKQYVITEAEMNSLFDQLKLVSMETVNVFRDDQQKPLTRNDMHRAFHYVCVRWAQDMGFSGRCT